MQPQDRQSIQIGVGGLEFRFVGSGRIIMKFSTIGRAKKSLRGRWAFWLKYGVFAGALGKENKCNLYAPERI